MFDLERIRKISILTVAKDFGFSLSRSGGGRCRLPDHEDSNPSFSVRVATNRFVCFSCGRRGSVIDLAKIMEGIDFIEACRWLEARYLGGPSKPTRNVPKPTRSLARRSTQDGEGVAIKTRADVEVFGWMLERSPLLPDGAQYLASRAFSPETLAHFRVGQIGDGRDLLHAATARWGRDRLVACGLVKETRRADELVFPSRYLLFPFLVGDKVAYLQARRPDGGQARRWLCPSHLPPPLFNADTLTTAGTTITLCEGVTDVLSAFELGKDAVGLLGASSRLDGQTVPLFRGRNLAVLGDADKAGRSFAHRMSALFAPHGLTIIRKRLPSGCNDLNDYLLATRKTAHELA